MQVGGRGGAPTDGAELLVLGVLEVGALKVRAAVRVRAALPRGDVVEPDLKERVRGLRPRAPRSSLDVTGSGGVLVKPPSKVAPDLLGLQGHEDECYPRAAGGRGLGYSRDMGRGKSREGGETCWASRVTRTSPALMTRHAATTLNSAVCPRGRVGGLLCMRRTSRSRSPGTWVAR